MAFQDRTYRLHNNKKQVNVDYDSIIGIAAGALTAAALRKDAATTLAFCSVGAFLGIIAHLG